MQLLLSRLVYGKEIIICMKCSLFERPEAIKGKDKMF